MIKLFLIILICCILIWIIYNTYNMSLYTDLEPPPPSKKNKRKKRKKGHPTTNVFK
jgi:hypothetical protein